MDTGTGDLNIDAINRRLDEWASLGLPHRPNVLSVFSAGKNHHCALVDWEGSTRVLKIFNHSFEQAVEAQRYAADLGLAPKVIFQGDNTIVMEHLRDQPTKVNELAISLNRLHTAPTPNIQGLDLPKFIDGYLKFAPKELQAWSRLLFDPMNTFFEDTTRHCFCHNDLVNENCLRKNDRAVFIDWEYAALNNPWFDLAAIIFYRDLTDKEATEFLQTYRGWGDQLNTPIFFSSQITLLWGDLLWHVHTFGSTYIKENLDRFEKLRSLAKQMNITLPIFT